VPPQVGKTRVRQHVNPLCVQYQTPLGPLPWEQIYADPSLPLVVDLGCGYGRFLLLLQRRKPCGFNYLGIEIRQKVRRGRVPPLPAPPALPRPPSRCCCRTPVPAPPLPTPPDPRAPQLVDRANKWAEVLGCSGSVHYVFTNATISLAPMLSSYPGRVDQVRGRGPSASPGTRAPCIAQRAGLHAAGARSSAPYPPPRP
jgi:tRNA (guanine-N7-)-methyltransferase